MDKIYTVSTTHWLLELKERLPNGDGLGKTACGRTVKGVTGGCIPELILCGNCRRTMRKKGYKVSCMTSC